MKAQLLPEGGQIEDAPPVIYTKSSRSIIFDIRMWKKTLFTAPVDLSNYHKLTYNAPKNISVWYKNFPFSIKGNMSAPQKLPPPKWDPPKCEPPNPHFHILPFWHKCIRNNWR